MQRAVMARFPLPGSLERDVLPGLVSRQRALAFPCEAPFVDIGTPESYALLKAHPERFIPQQW